jgi:hypothetical protein
VSCNLTDQRMFVLKFTLKWLTFLSWIGHFLIFLSRTIADFNGQLRLAIRVALTYAFCPDRLKNREDGNADGWSAMRSNAPDRPPLRRGRTQSMEEGVVATGSLGPKRPSRRSMTSSTGVPAASSVELDKTPSPSGSRDANDSQPVRRRSSIIDRVAQNYHSTVGIFAHPHRASLTEDLMKTPSHPAGLVLTHGRQSVLETQESEGHERMSLRHRLTRKSHHSSLHQSLENLRTYHTAAREHGSLSLAARHLRESMSINRNSINVTERQSLLLSSAVADEGGRVKPFSTLLEEHSGQDSDSDSNSERGVPIAHSRNRMPSILDAESNINELPMGRGITGENKADNKEDVLRDAESVFSGSENGSIRPAQQPQLNIIQEFDQEINHMLENLVEPFCIIEGFNVFKEKQKLRRLADRERRKLEAGASTQEIKQDMEEFSSETSSSSLFDCFFNRVVPLSGQFSSAMDQRAEVENKFNSIYLFNKPIYYFRYVCS